MYVRALVLSALLATASYAAPPPDATPPEPSVTLPPDLARVLTDYEAAWRGRDATALARLFAEDGFVLPNGHAPVRGRAAVERYYAASGGPLVLRAIAFAVDGGVGYILGAFARQPGEADIGKFTLTLRKGADGRWLIASDMDSSNGPRSGPGRVVNVAEMNTEQIRALDRGKTVVLLPGGILEEHGPYLPSYSDGYFNERLTRSLAASIAARPGWTALVFPTIPLGNSPANEVGGIFSFPGSYPVRFETLRRVYMDLATELGEQGFRWAFVVHGHGGPNHNRALDQAGDWFGDTYGGHMVNLVGLMPVFDAWAGRQSEAEKAEDGLPIHSGMGETSSLLFLRPDLVAPGHRDAKPFADQTMEGLVRIARRPGWPGYFGSPRLATAAKGETDFGTVERVALETAARILDGFDERKIPRYGDEVKKSPADVALDRASLQHEAKVRQRQDRWLGSRGAVVAR